MLFVFVCAPVHAYGHSDRCWTAIVMDSMSTWMHCLLVGGVEYWQGAIVKFGRPGIDSSVQ